ncbi:MoaF C-terminal domain-containing protein [Fodinicola acaciae]|uniref:MoaF C-terminal domain-containing protein n=1 Tax=Fodinicola acaciae TaxID=2681555 RepID=UPI0013CF963D|nr:MoaF C-terminal domain-containing protein [Fodinicola acaciae]
MPDTSTDEWRTYDEFAAGIDTFRLPAADLSGRTLTVNLDDGGQLDLRFLDAERLSCDGVEDPYDAVAVRDDVFFVNMPMTSVDGEALTVVFSTTTHRAIVVRSTIGAEEVEGVPRVSQTFSSGTTDGGTPTGVTPGPSRDLIGKRNVYRYSPNHLYEHVYLSSQRYAWQCVEGVQRGHGDVDLSTVWKFADGLYLFCFREFRIAVASVWLHDLGYALRTTGVFLGLTGGGRSEHSRAGGHIYPLGAVSYPDVQPI